MGSRRIGVGRGDERRGKEKDEGWEDKIRRMETCGWGEVLYTNKHVAK